MPGLTHPDVNLPEHLAGRTDSVCFEVEVIELLRKFRKFLPHPTVSLPGGKYFF